MSTTGFSKRLVERLRRKAFRDAYVDEHLRTWLAYQVSAIREQRGWSQAELAKLAGKPQSVISRLENPDYGRFTLRTLLDLASAWRPARPRAAALDGCPG
jgi:predicted XRE-type DNA-binding protein